MKTRSAIAFILLAGTFLLFSPILRAQNNIVWSDEEKPIVEQLHKMRSYPDDVRATITKDLAHQIQVCPPVNIK